MQKFFLLSLPNDSNVFSEFLECFKELSAIFSECFPINKRALSSKLQNIIKMRLDIFYF